MQTEHATLETKNHELGKAFKEKSIAQQHVHKLYQTLKAQVMASHVANAAGDEAEMAIHTARGDRCVDRFPGARTGSANYSRTGTSHRPGVGAHTRVDSRSSGSGEQQRSGIGIGRSYVHNLPGHGLSGRLHSGRESIKWHVEIFADETKTLHPWVRLLKPNVADFPYLERHVRMLSRT